MQKNIIKIWIIAAICLLLASCSESFTTAEQPIQVKAKSAQITQLAPDTTNIALLLPMSGQFGGNGQAIRNGFFAAYYHASQSQQRKLTISVIDTNQQNIVTVYNQAVNQGAQMVVGPLTKPEIQALATLGDLPVPTLALNTMDNYQSIVNNLYQFGLAPSDEILQVADKARSNNLHNAVIIAPTSAWGQNLATKLSNYWQHKSGNVVNILAYSKTTDISAAIQQTFEISMPQTAKNNNSDALPISQSKADVIFLIASPEQGRQIQPLLKFYLLGRIPVYAISNIYSGTPQPTLDNDLDGIIFCDIPWVFPNPPINTTLLSLRKQLSDLWSDSYKNYIRMYALGVDSYYLALSLHRLNEHIGIAGTTGVLYLDQYNHIYRQLNWAKMQDGVPVLLN